MTRGPGPCGRVMLSLAALTLWAGATALLRAGAPVWAAVCGVPAAALGLGAAITGVLARRLVAVTVRGMSMAPTYRNGDRVLVHRHRVPAVGQVVVVERPMLGAQWSGPPLARDAPAEAVSNREWIIKRVAAAPGDPVPYTEIPALAAQSGDRVPPGQLVLLGDNRDLSADSRLMGYLPTERVLGAVLRRLPR